MRKEKLNIVKNIQAWLQASPYLIVVDYSGLKVEQFNELRNRLAGVKSELHVVKNNFLRKALQEVQLPELDSHLQGQTAVAYGPSDVSAAAKILKNFKAEFEKPTLRAAIVDRNVLGAADVMALASLPSREVMLAQLLGLIQTPATRLAAILNVPASQLAQVIKAKSEKGE